MVTVIVVLIIACVVGIILCGLIFKVPEGYVATKGGDRIYNAGWNFGFASGCTLIHAARKTLKLEPQRLLLPDGAGLDMTVSIVWAPDTMNIGTYLQSDVEQSLTNDVQARLSKWVSSKTEGPQTWQQGIEAAAQHEAEEILTEELTSTPRKGLVPVEARGLMKLGYKSNDLGIVIHRVSITDVKPLVTKNHPIRDYVKDEKDADTIMSETETKVKKLKELETRRAAMKKENPELADDIDRMMDAARSRILEQK